jgi:hypothetical protein
MTADTVGVSTRPESVPENSIIRHDDFNYSTHLWLKAVTSSPAPKRACAILL